jgi:tripartite-type tricarboxylate transporter receptor subunit TctC
MRYHIDARRDASRWLIFALASAMLLCAPASWAQTAATNAGQTFPSKIVRYVVPFGAGGSPDIVGRLMADRLTRVWGQQVIVDNRVGAAGVLGTAFVAKSPPDGHTILQCNIASSAIAVSLFAKMPYDQLRDLAAVTRIGITPNILTVHPSLPIRSIKLNTDITAVLRMPEIQQRMEELAMPVAPTSREEFDQFIRAEIARWAQVIKDAGIPQQ